MAAKRRRASETAVSEEPIAAAATAPPTLPSPRRTRSSTARAASQPSIPIPQPSKKSKPSKEKKNPVKDDPIPQKPLEKALPVLGPKTIIVEACKQCRTFSTRAMKVKEGLEKGVPDIIVTINPEKPRRGCFEVRTGSGKTFVSLLNMPRPFNKMRELDMDKVVEDIIENLND